MWRCPYCFAEMLTRSRSGHLFEEQAGLQSAACPALGRGGQEEGGGALLRQRDLLFARDLVCFARRRALRDAVLCSVMQPSAVGQFPCFVCPCLCSPSLSLGGGGPCLSLHFLVPFWQEEHKTQQDRDSDCLHSMSLLPLAFSGAASPATEIFCALRAALCSPRYK